MRVVQFWHIMVVAAGASTMIVGPTLLLGGFASPFVAFVAWMHAVAAAVWAVIAVMWLEART